MDGMTINAEGLLIERADSGTEAYAAERTSGEREDATAADRGLPTDASQIPDESCLAAELDRIVGLL